jgi:transcription-repair coupling factor (superfamily II helicase)
MSDLQIRGGGNILGVSQSGHIAAVGYDLYLELLQNTVSDLKQQADKKEIIETIDPEINLQISAYIPEKYIADTPQRYIAYRKIAGLADAEQLADLKDELQDRFGPLPEETQTLFDMMTVKMKMQDIMITKLEQGKDMLVFSFHEKTPIGPDRILSLIEKAKNTIRFSPDARLIVPLSSKISHSPQAILHAASEIIDTLQVETT